MHSFYSESASRIDQTTAIRKQKTHPEKGGHGHPQLEANYREHVPPQHHRFSEAALSAIRMTRSQGCEDYRGYFVLSFTGQF
jgi:hypothetical protein